MRRNQKMATLDLSIIIVSYNTAVLTVACIRAVRATLAATAPELTYDIFVVDNASADDTLARLRREFGGDLILIANEINVGFAAANNQALCAARGRYILLLNPDTEPRETAIVSLLHHLEQNPKVGAVGPALIYPDGRAQECVFRFPTLAQLALDFFPLNWRLTRSRLNGRYPQAWLSPDHPPFAIDFPLGACIMTRREVLDDVGGMDDSFFIYMEEIDWCWRVAKAGWRIVCVPAARVVHVGGASTSQFRAKMFVQLQKSRAIFFHKHHSREFQIAARLITRVAMLWFVLRDYGQYRQGNLDWAALRERTASYGQVWRLR